MRWYTGCTFHDTFITNTFFRVGIGLFTRSALIRYNILGPGEEDSNDPDLQSISTPWPTFPRKNHPFCLCRPKNEICRLCTTFIINADILLFSFVKLLNI